MTREEFDERINKTLVSMDVTYHTVKDDPERWGRLFEAYKHMPEEALELIMKDAIDEYSRSDGAMYN